MTRPFVPGETSLKEKIRKTAETSDSDSVLPSLHAVGSDAIAGRLAIFAMVARLQPVVACIELHDCLAAIIWAIGGSAATLHRGPRDNRSTPGGAAR